MQKLAAFGRAEGLELGFPLNYEWIPVLQTLFPNYAIYVAAVHVD